MNRLVFATAAAALLSSIAFANDPQNTQIAAVDNSPAAFAKLDMDKDGRLSAIEAANDSSIAAAFTRADMDKDGYLSDAEFRSLNGGGASSSTPASDADATMPSQSDMPATDDGTAPPQ